MQALAGGHRLPEAIEVGFEALAELGIHFPKQVGLPEIGAALVGTAAVMPDDVESLLDRPAMTDREALVA